MPNIFAIKVLTEKLNKERFDLVLYNLATNTIGDEFLSRWGKGNVNSCEKRIEDLETAIEKLNAKDSVQTL